jgi:hypothetical protein
MMLIEIDLTPEEDERQLKELKEKVKHSLEG